MRPPIFACALTDEERAPLKTGRHSSDGVPVRRCQMVLASARGERAPQIAVLVGGDEKPVRQLIHRFTRRGLEVLPRGFARALVHRSPRDFGHRTSRWTRDRAAAVRFTHGLMDHRVTGEAIRMPLLLLGIGCKRAKHRSTSPAPADARKKGDATA
jgi:hypothetical protein